jgi:hypothetical protein
MILLVKGRALAPDGLYNHCITGIAIQLQVFENNTTYYKTTTLSETYNQL